MSIVSTLSIFILANSVATEALLSRNYISNMLCSLKVKKEDWKEWARVVSMQRDAGRPWHVFEMRWKKFCDDTSHILLHALDCVGQEYLCVKNRRLFVKGHDIFARWQNLRSRMTMLPIKYRMFYKERLHLRNMMVHPYSSCMADYIQREGLNECHLHLHACMSPELSWLISLNKLSAYEKYVQKMGGEKLRALYTAVHPELTVEKMMHRMRFARVLRYQLIEATVAEDVCAAVKKMGQIYKEFVSFGFFDDSSTYVGEISDNIDVLECQEQKLWLNLFELADRNVPGIDALLFFAHLYLLIQNDYLQLCRMNEVNKGFDAFQVRAHYSSLGYPLENYYRRAFRQMLNSSSVTDRTCIEVRISPRIFWQKGELLERIWKGCCAERENVLPRLILTVHFLKGVGNPLKAFDDTSRVERYANMRKRLRKECGKLVSGVNCLSQRCDMGISIDGAGNELQCPPSVMAPVFRQFERETGISYKTYHCGEDFYHLISGIRSVYEGVEFLELKQGNRIGHATAVGIPPNKWRENIPEVVVLRKGDWFLDLIFIWKILLECNHRDVLKIEQTMLPIAMEIFEGIRSEVSVHSLSAFYDARQLDPEYLTTAIAATSDKSWSPIEEEYRAIQFRRHRGVCGVKLFRYWLQDRDSIDEQNKLIEVERDFLDADTLLLLQQKVQHIINERNVVLEALPVSNVRISQYQDMRQHHILRWMGVKGHTLPGDEEMTVCIGSDDPGIFVSDIKNEFYHIFANLRCEGLTPDECMKYIRRLNHAGRVYSFREKIIKDENYEFADWPTLAETMKSEPKWP